MDVRHFYMSGTYDVVVDYATRHLEAGERKSVLMDTIGFLINSQFTKSVWLEGLWQVVVGTGHGLEHSSDVADATLNNMAERWVDSNMSDFGIQRFWRFKDDICFIASNRALTFRFVEKLRCLAYIFDFSVEAVSSKEITYLEVSVTMMGNRWHIVPHVKATNLGMPLSHESAHPVGVHVAWPLAQISRLAQLTNVRNSIAHVKSLLCTRFRRFLVEPKIIELVISQRTHARRHKTMKDRDAKRIWCPIGYHPIWHKRFSAAIAKFNSDISMQTLLRASFEGEKGFKIAIAWKNILPVHEFIIRRTARPNAARRADGWG